MQLKTWKNFLHAFRLSWKLVLSTVILVLPSLAFKLCGLVNITAKKLENLSIGNLRMQKSSIAVFNRHLSGMWGNVGKKGKGMKQKWNSMADEDREGRERQTGQQNQARVKPAESYSCWDVLVKYSSPSIHQPNMPMGMLGIYRLLCVIYANTGG